MLLIRPISSSGTTKLSVSSSPIDITTASTEYSSMSRGRRVKTTTRPRFSDDYDDDEERRYYASWDEEVLAQDMRDMGEDPEIGLSILEVQSLQTSLGPDVVDEDLQRRIDEATETRRPNLFLDNYVEQDATSVEKFAMSTLPQQLPRPAVTALHVSKNNEQKKNKSSNRMKKVDALNYARGRVTPEQEIELGKQIQEGVRIHKIKLDFEAKHGRTITRPEWTKLAGLKTNRELRKRVSEYRNAKQLLVYTNMGLVHAVINARNYKTDQQREELVQEGSLGLLRAAELFDPSRGIRFSTYATIWIKGVLSNTKVNDIIRLPQREKSKWAKIRKAQAELSDELGRTAKPEEIAKKTNLDVEDVMTTTQKMTQTRFVYSLDYAYSFKSRGGYEEGGQGTLMDNQALMDDADMAEKAQLHADVVAALARNLDSREERLMRLRYGLVDGMPRSLQECADMMGISYSLAQQLSKKCLSKLRKAQEAESLHEYLINIC